MKQSSAPAPAKAGRIRKGKGSIFLKKLSPVGINFIFFTGVRPQMHLLSVKHGVGGKVHPFSKVYVPALISKTKIYGQVSMSENKKIEMIFGQHFFAV